MTSASGVWWIVVSLVDCGESGSYKFKHGGLYLVSLNFLFCFYLFIRSLLILHTCLHTYFHTF